MATPHYKLLAQSLSLAKKQAIRGVLHVKDLSRIHRERLELDGWLTRVIRGWYILRQPIDKDGESTYWYSAFWDFISVYLTRRFGKDYCLSANDSINIHLGSTTIPKQLLVMVNKGGSSVIHLPFSTSIMIYQETKAFPEVTEQIKNINIMPLAVALYRVSPKFFQQQASDAELALKLVESSSLARELLGGANIASAGRLIAGYYFIGEEQRAKQLESSLLAAGYQPEIVNPFTIKKPSLANYPRIRSPYAARITMMWQKMREDVLTVFPKDPGIFKNAKNYFTRLEKIYVNDAYNSLSIEGYEVSEELIAQIANNEWDPGQSINDKNQVNAMAAKGYRQAFEAVKLSINRIFQKENSGKVIKEDSQSWYSALFSSSVKAGLLKPEQLAGYRTHQVYIRHSMHTPLPKDALIDAMEAYFDCLIQEPSAAVRAILGHFIFVFIHPYMDGNGRIGRFIMNSLFASGGFEWTIVTVVNRSQYIKALELASVERNIKPFAKFILSEMNRGQSDAL